MPPSNSAPTSQALPTEPAPLSNASSSASPDVFEAYEDAEMQHMYERVLAKKCRLQAQVEDLAGRPLRVEAALTDAVALMEQSYNMLREELKDQCRKNVDALKKHQEDMDEQLQKRDAGVADLQQQVQKRDADVADLQRQVQKRDADVADLQQQVQQRDGTIVELQRQIATQAEKIRSQRDEIIPDLQRQVATLTQEFRNQRASHDQLIRETLHRMFREGTL